MEIIKSKISRNGLYNLYYIYDDYIQLGFANAPELFIIDISDFDTIRNYSWYPKRSEWGTYCNGYVNKKVVVLHRFIMKAQVGQYIDHIDKDTLNNKRDNLRFVTNQQNGFNRKVGKNNTSSIMGICWVESRNKWNVRIKLNYKNIFLGQYEDFDDAVKSRLQAEKLYFDDFAPQKHLFEEYGIK
jgi:hypothetical protein